MRSRTNHSHRRVLIIIYIIFADKTLHWKTCIGTVGKRHFLQNMTKLIRFRTNQWHGEIIHWVMETIHRAETPVVLMTVNISPSTTINMMICLNQGVICINMMYVARWNLKACN